MNHIAPVKVLIVDDHALLRKGIAAVLTEQDNLRVIGEAVNGLEAIDKAKELAPDVILMDLNMPVCSGLEAIHSLQADMPQISVLILTVSENDKDLFDAIEFGARGYLLKNADPDELIRAIQQVSHGGAVVSPLMASKLLTEFTQLTSQPQTDMENTNLSQREEEVLQQLAKGLTNKQIADLLFISENTVKTHLRSIMDKLHLANRSQAAAYAAKRNLPHATDTANASKIPLKD